MYQSLQCRYMLVKNPRQKKIKINSLVNFEPPIISAAAYANLGKQRLPLIQLPTPESGKLPQPMCTARCRVGLQTGYEIDQLNPDSEPLKHFGNSEGRVIEILMEQVFDIIKI